MMIKTCCLDLLRISVSNSSLEQTNYLTFHSSLAALIAETVRSSNMIPSAVLSPLIETQLTKWDAGLWKFTQVDRESSDAAVLLNPNIYFIQNSLVLGPDNKTNSEWMLSTFLTSVHLIYQMSCLYFSNPAYVTNPITKMIQEQVFQSFALFHVLSEFETPIKPWINTPERWTQETMKMIIECKTELMKLIQAQMDTRGPLGELAKGLVLNNYHILVSISKGIIDIQEINVLRLCFEMLRSGLKSEPDFLTTYFKPRDIPLLEDNIYKILSVVLYKNISECVNRFKDLCKENKDNVFLIRRCIDSYYNNAQFIAYMALHVLVAFSQSGLKCVSDPEYTEKFARCYLEYITSIQNSLHYFKNTINTLKSSTEINASIEKCIIMKDNIERKALYLSSVITRKKECSDIFSQTSLLLHFLIDSVSLLNENSNSIFTSSVLIYNIFTYADEITTLLKYQDRLLPMIVQLLQSPEVPMEALCICIKMLRNLIDIIGPKERKIVRPVLPVLSGIMSSKYPQIRKETPLQLQFLSPEMILQDAWILPENPSGYLGKDELLKETKYIIEAFNEIKPTDIAQARSSMLANSRYQENNQFIEHSDLIRLRKELHSILLRNGGHEPLPDNREDYERYQLLQQRIDKREIENPTILSEIDALYKEILQQKIPKK